MTTKKNASKRVWMDLSVSKVGKGKKLSSIELNGEIDLEGLKASEHVFALKNEAEAVAKKGVLIMKDPKVVLFRKARDASKLIGPMLAKMNGGSADFHGLSSWDPKIAQAVEVYYKADKVLKDTAFVAEAKALIAQADVIFTEAKKKQSDAKALAMQYGMNWEGISA
jgi:hypothetical protein